MAKIIPLSEGSFTVDGTKQFVPFDAKTDALEERGRGSILVEIQPFLVITGKDYLLLDTGLGFSHSGGGMWLHETMRKNGIEPSRITKVLMSHLHKDHAGGISMEDKATGAGMLSFPQATYYVNEQELNYAFSQDGKSYHAEDFRLLKEAKNVVLTPDKGDIDGYIHYEMTGGHSPFHQVFWIRDEEDVCFFGGDVAPQLSQIKSRFIAKYDYDGRKSMELRQAYVKEGKAGGWTFLFYHDIRTPFIRLEQAEL